MRSIEREKTYSSKFEYQSLSVNIAKLIQLKDINYGYKKKFNEIWFLKGSNSCSHFTFNSQSLQLEALFLCLTCSPVLYPFVALGKRSGVIEWKFDILYGISFLLELFIIVLSHLMFFCLNSACLCA